MVSAQGWAGCSGDAPETVMETLNASYTRSVYSWLYLAIDEMDIEPATGRESCPTSDLSRFHSIHVIEAGKAMPLEGGILDCWMHQLVVNLIPQLARELK